MEKDHEQNTKKIDLKLKIVRDLGFLLQLHPIPVNQRVTKYLIHEGQGQSILADDQELFDLVYSYTKYDYEGKVVQTVHGAKMSNKQSKDVLMNSLLMGMKMKQKAWFNICDQEVYRRKGISEHIGVQNDAKLVEQFFGDEDMPIVEQQQTTAEQQENKVEEKHQKSTIQQTLSNQNIDQPFELIDGQFDRNVGYHFQILVQRIQYKNSENFDTKMKVIQQKKQQARIYFTNKKYEQASKIYNYLDSITHNLRKYKKDPLTNTYTSQSYYTPEQLLQLQKKNINAKQNYLKCFFRMIEQVSTDQKEMAKKYVEYLLDRQSQNATTHFLHAKWLLHQRMLDNALDAAKRSRQLQRNRATEDLIALIQLQRANKHKIKVKVQS